ncbi:zinc finger transcription factor YY1-like [Phragmites australis]|uniref:zinc finger transcription factor YY1-like n=1 Tax=Phragmites australis TaxID=29695 RepID=UPI002D769E51|nr:zinc finger transcription factor YY1-like [Phragmites australis]
MQAASCRHYGWVKEWVPQDLVVAGGPCALYKWVREDRFAALKAKDKEQGAESAKPEPNNEVLFLCSYEGCGKFFVDVGALRKHAHVHGEKQYICHYENCGKKFLDSSKLKRHFLIHTGEKNFVCSHEGCGKAFSLDFNLKAHMKTHSADNYHMCPYPECGRRFTQESKLRAHIRAQHEKNPGASTMNHNAPDHHHHKTVKPSATPPAPSAERPYVCPYDGCDKAYIHEYKLNLHLKKEHPYHYQDAGAQGVASSKGTMSKNSKRSKPNVTAKMAPPKIPKCRGGYAVPSPAVNIPEEHQWQREVLYEDDSEETEEEGDNVEDGWRYRAASSDDEETEDEE